MPFIQQLGALVFYKSTIPFRFYLVPPSRINPPFISTILWHCTTSYEFLLVRYFSSIVANPHVLGCRQPRTLNTFLLAIPFPRCRRYSMASSQTSRHDVSWSSSPLDFSKCLLNS